MANHCPHTSRGLKLHQDLTESTALSRDAQADLNIIA